MSSEDRAHRMDEEIAEIEDRKGKRNLFLILGGIVGTILLVIVVFGARERARISELESRPQSEPVELGTYVGTVASTAVFARDGRLSYIEGIGDASIDADTRFARSIAYDAAGEPDTIPSNVYHWSLSRSDSLPYLIEPVARPLLGVDPTEYREMELGSMRASDYGTGGPDDWRSLEQEGENIQITGEAALEESSVYLTSDSVRARLQGIEGLAPLDSLEVAWAVENSAPLTAYGRITNTPRGGDTSALFVVTVNAVQPPSSAVGGATAPADTTASGVDTTSAVSDTVRE